MADHYKWNYRFLELASVVASWSKDPSTKVGCVIVDDLRRVVAVGYNGFPRGVSDNLEDYLDREKKYSMICHADRNALDNAPCDVRGMTMYITHPPCRECQKSIIQKGIRAVVFYGGVSKAGFHSRWTTDVKLLEQAGIELYSYPEKLKETHETTQRTN